MSIFSPNDTFFNQFVIPGASKWSGEEREEALDRIDKAVKSTIRQIEEGRDATPQERDEIIVQSLFEFFSRFKPKDFPEIDLRAARRLYDGALFAGLVLPTELTREIRRERERCKEHMAEVEEENKVLRALLRRISKSKRVAHYDAENNAIAFIEIEGGFTTLDEVDEAIGYDEMGQ